MDREAEALRQYQQVGGDVRRQTLADWPGGGVQEGRPFHVATPSPLLPCPLMTMPQAANPHLTVTLPLLEVIL